MGITHRRAIRECTNISGIGSPHTHTFIDESMLYKWPMGNDCNMCGGGLVSWTMTHIRRKIVEKNESYRGYHVRRGLDPHRNQN